MAQIKLTDSYVAGLPPGEKQYTVSDTTEGLFIVVGARSKTWTVRINAPDPQTGKSRPFKKTLGKFPAMPVRAARAAVGAAREKLRGDAEAGEERRQSETLREAWTRLSDHLRASGKSRATVEGYAYGIALAGKLADAPLSRLITSSGRRSVHDQAMQLRASKPGAYNAFVKTLRRVFRHAALTDNELLGVQPPTYGLEVLTLERDRSIPAGEMAAWWQALLRVPNGSQKALQLFLLLSGGRVGTERAKGGISRARWEDLDLRNSLLTIRDDKTGGYQIPLSLAMRRCLAWARVEGRKINPAASREFIFVSTPGKRRRGSKPTPGHLVTTAPRRDLLPYSNHDLRHTWASIVDDLGVSQADKDTLGNWKPKTMGGRYTKIASRDLARLLRLQDEISEEITGRLGIPRRRKKTLLPTVVPFAISEAS